MKHFFVFLFLLYCGIGIAACSGAPASTGVTAPASVAPTQVAVVASPTASNPPTQIAVTDVPSAVPPASTNTPAQAASANPKAQACATDDHAPLDAFRSDSAAKLTASAKPKFVEFYAVW